MTHLPLPQVTPGMPFRPTGGGGGDDGRALLLNAESPIRANLLLAFHLRAEAVVYLKGHRDSLPPPPPGDRQIEVGQALRQGEIGASAHPISP
jgi:hypothetical protein